MTSKDIVKLTGVHYRTLDYWVRSKLIQSSMAEAQGAGSEREYSMNDAVQCRIAVILRKMGIETSKLPAILKMVRAYTDTAFIVMTPDGDATGLPDTGKLPTFQVNRNAMLILNVLAIRADISGKLL